MGAVALIVAGCAGGAEPIDRAELVHEMSAAPAAPSASASAEAVASSKPRPRIDPSVQDELREVASLRGLPVHVPVPSFALGREAVLAKMKQKVAEELPPDLIAMQGEALRALGLVPPEFDLEQGYLKLFASRIAGFYDPDEKAMYMLDDLGGAQADETLPHELVHALQDQSFDIGAMMKYRPGASDRTAALQHLVEGDATLAGFLRAYGASFDLDPATVKTGFVLATALSREGAETPPILIGAIVSPYSDGYAFAKELYDHGGFAAVDDAFRRPPATTEQILHIERYRAGEPALAIAKITDGDLPGFTVKYDDENGELGLRLILEQWTSARVAATAAEGWGGDRWVVLAREGAGGTTYASALYTRMDTKKDADEVEAIVREHLDPKRKQTCVERADIGPLALRRRGRDVVIVGGPYQVAPDGPRSAGDCAAATRWLDQLIARGAE